MISTSIFVARSDIKFLNYTLPHLLNMLNSTCSNTTVVVDNYRPSGILSKIIPQFNTSELIELLEAHKKNYNFVIDFSIPNKRKVSQLNQIHFGKGYSETHCFRGYPIFGSIAQFHQSNSDYILHLDSDMIFYQAADFSWIQEGVKIMEKNEDILCVLPRGGPKSDKSPIPQGDTNYQVDNTRGLFLFKNFTSRHYLINRQRFLNLLPMETLWLSWREPIKSRLLGKGKMLCWEEMVSNALSKSKYWRADLQTTQSWSIHPGDRSEKFYKLLPKIIQLVQKGIFPEEQTSHFDLHLSSWEKLIKENY